jgi:hypothetical protein
MIPQDSFIIVAKVEPSSLDALRRLLKELTFEDCPGIADPANPLIPFRAYETIHFARLVVLEDNTLNDRVAFGLPPLDEPIYLCFMVDCDGPANELLTRMAGSPSGLREIFRHCEGFEAAPDLLGWLNAHRVKPMASYVNWVGRSVVQTLEEAQLHGLLRNALPGIQNSNPQWVFAHLKSMVKPGMLTAPPPTPLTWRIRNLLEMLLPLVIAGSCLILFPFTTILLLCLGTLAFVIVLRRHEQTDPIVPQPYDPKWVARLREGEDHDVTNQYTAMGSIKPGRFRLCTEIVILYGIDWIARHIFNRGSIGRIGTIHFAHWVFLDQHRRGLFCSSYDGGHEAYMDDFINKAGFGLNISFSSFIGYPTTNWLVARGAWLEQDFKRFQRHHQIPTDVWYKAYPGLTARDLARNSRIRNGVEKTAMNDDEIRRWLAEI